MKFTTVATTAALVASVAAAPAPQAQAAAVAEGEATFGIISGILNSLFGGWGNKSYYYKKKITIIKDYHYRDHYYNFPPQYVPCGCHSDAAYAVSEDKANELLQDSSYAVETNTAVTALPDDADAAGAVQPVEDAANAAPAPAPSA
ncbi:hypothetical protein DIURU_004454 [Diutina rugosa]|uniref:Uncharacterized protein n=1 Tax=Diutina rugosa TaxID=5481 RepID=A0A642UHF2_DIURU|nr:uncharacterized protein DIURU_004454 [Diutina rugosa]KAA8899073.1 hypothetical protein DIURU_004454 [Diutina rugosa]